MMDPARVAVVMISFTAVAGLAACNQSSSPMASSQAAAVELQVHKTAACGCCEGWVEHIEDNGFSAQVFNHDELSSLKAEYQIPRRYQSCHTAVSQDGYVFEGHIPAKVVRRFLDEKPPDALGLTVPGMPVGSPGMESGESFMPYQVLLLMRDGTTVVYAEMGSMDEQH